jgi:hypothetical protein
MTKELLRWEDSPGLGKSSICRKFCYTTVADPPSPEHHCPKCQTPLNNPRAKHTCYFKHVEICPLFHQHFFMIGKLTIPLLTIPLYIMSCSLKAMREREPSKRSSTKQNKRLTQMDTGQAHNCDTCRRNKNAHDERHRQLALLLRQLAQLQQDQGLEPSVCPASPFSLSKRSAFSCAADDDPETTPKLKKRERKKAKKRIKALRGGDALTTAEVAFVANALHPPSRNNSSSSASSSCTYTTEPSDNSTDDEAASPTSLSIPASPITPTTPNPSLVNLMNANKAFHPDVDGKLNSSRVSLQTSLLHILDTTYPSLDTSLANALSALSIPDISSKTPRCIADVVGKITEAIREDLGCAEGEVRKFHLREAGWYRFVNRSVLALREE